MSPFYLFLPLPPSEKILLANPSDYSDSMALYFADVAILVVTSVGDFDEVNSR